MFARGGVLGIIDRLGCGGRGAHERALLETAALSKTFGALAVTSDVDFRLEAGARHALIGPNGAGKTTFINLITGQLKPTAGRMLLGGEDVTALPQAARVKRGIGRTFQINRLFRNLTVLENVTLAVSERAARRRHVALRPARGRDIVEEAYALLERFASPRMPAAPVREIAYGRQRLVEMAVALGLKPKVLLLDEPAAGVPSAESALILDVIESLPPEIAVLIIEHDMDLVFRFARTITVLVQGAVLAEGTPGEIVADPRVREVYLGRAAWLTA